MAENFYTILTDVGKAKIANATSSGGTVNITEMAAGDGGGDYYEPNEDQTALQNEVWRNSINDIKIDADNSNWVVVDAIIPSDTGGFYIREAGIFDSDGDLIAIGKYPETYKPTLDSGSAKDLHLRMIIEVSNSDVVDLQIDPSIIMASREWVNDKVGFLTNLTTAVKENIVKAINSLKDALDTHKAESAPHQQQELLYLTDPGTGTTYKIGIDDTEQRMYYEEVTS